MGLDIRLPIGLMFSILGPILLVTGWLNDTSLNLFTGGAMLLFGGTMLGFGLHAHRQAAALVTETEAEPRR